MQRARALGGWSDVQTTSQLVYRRHDEEMQEDTKDNHGHMIENIENIQEDIEDFQEDTKDNHEDMLENIKNIQEDIEDLQEDTKDNHGHMLENIENIQEDIEDLQEDTKDNHEDMLENIENMQEDIEDLQEDTKGNHDKHAKNNEDAQKDIEDLQEDTQANDEDIKKTSKTSKTLKFEYIMKARLGQLEIRGEDTGQFVTRDQMKASLLTFLGGWQRWYDSENQLFRDTSAARLARVREERVQPTDV
ncbi:hypothetical protein J6590_029511 [Homalodisca vitripennis]|nr:hypothetical protein J6590_029511 [Homalodisca vitripennis]